MMRLLCVLSFVLLATTSSEAQFVRGDVNDDGQVNVGDPVSLLEVLFAMGTPPLSCEDRGDVNDDGNLNIADAVSLLGWLFTMGSPPPPPFPTEGGDPTPDGLAGTCGIIVPPGPGQFFTIASGDDSALPDDNYIVRDQASWSMIWGMHQQGSPPPQVDFSTDIVIGVVRHFVNGDHCAEIVGLTDVGTDVLVNVRIQDSVLPCAILILPTEMSHWVRWENAVGVPSNLSIVEQSLQACPVMCP